MSRVQGTGNMAIFKLENTRLGAYLHRSVTYGKIFAAFSVLLPVEAEVSIFTVDSEISIYKVCFFLSSCLRMS